MQYKGLDVVALGSRTESNDYKRELSVLTATNGKRVVFDKAGVPFISRNYLWQAFSREEVARLRAFILARFGAYKAFWLPTGNHDLFVAEETPAGSSAVRVKGHSYRKNYFDAGNSRRHLAVLTANGDVLDCLGVSACISNLDGTDTLVLASPIAAGLTTGTPLSFLTYSRLDADTVELSFSSMDVAEAQLKFVEIPKETPPA